MAKTEEKQKVLVYSIHKGLIYGMPMADGIPSKPGEKKNKKTRSVVLAEKNNEMDADTFEAIKPSIQAHLDSGLLRVVTVETDKLDKNGQKTGHKEVSNAEFQKLSPDEQEKIVENCTDLEALKRWKKMRGLDGSVNGAIRDQLKRIENFEAGNGSDSDDED